MESPGSEPKLAVIPRVVKYSLGSIRQYSVLLTDHRLIFVLSSLSKMHLVGAALGGVIGASIAASGVRDSSVSGMSYVLDGDPVELASLPNGLVIRYDGIRRLTIRKFNYPAQYELVIDYVTEAGKKDGIRVQLKAPDLFEARANAAGVDRKTMLRTYASETQSALLRALPSAIAARAEWKF